VVFPFLVCCTKKNLATLVAEEGLHMVEFSLNNSCKSGTAKICTYVWINPWTSFKAKKTYWRNDFFQNRRVACRVLWKVTGWSGTNVKIFLICSPKQSAKHCIMATTEYVRLRSGANVMIFKYFREKSILFYCYWMPKMVITLLPWKSPIFFRRKLVKIADNSGLYVLYINGVLHNTKSIRYSVDIW
jgi:hypothetical protein